MIVYRFLIYVDIFKISDQFRYSYNMTNINVGLLFFFIRYDGEIYKYIIKFIWESVINYILKQNIRFTNVKCNWLTNIK